MTATMPGTRRAVDGLDVALAHARRGRAVFPWKVIRGQKMPLIAGGHLSASTDEAAIIGWWKRWPDARAGWALPVGLVVADLDDPAAFAATGLELPDAPEQRGTLKRPDGLHRLYSCPDGRQSQGELPGLDTRAGGSGWVALYSLDAFAGEPPPAPAWFPRARPSAATNGHVDVLTVDGPHTARAAIADGRLWLPKGSRDGGLASIAGTLLDAGATAEATTIALQLIDAAGAIEQPPGDELRDFDRIAHSMARTHRRNHPEAPAGTVGTLTALDLPHGLPPAQLADPFLTSEGATVIYGKGGTGKGLLACWLIARLVEAGHVPMIVDYEGHPREWGSRLRGLGLDDDALGRVAYRAPYGQDWTAPTGALSKVADQLRAEADRLGATVIVVDSYSVATSNGDTMGGEQAAREFFTGLTLVGRPSLVIAHTRGDAGRFPDRPFGSVFVRNLARELWAVERIGAEPETDPDAIRHGPAVVALELHNTKANGRPMAPAQFVGFSFFADGSIEVDNMRPDGRAVANMVADVLADGPMTVAAIGRAIQEDTGERVTEDVLRVTLKRARDRFSEDRSARPRRWALR